MANQVVVLGSGYGGAGAIKSLESALDGEAEVTWVSDTDYHLVLHESHRCIRDPSVKEKITIPIEEIKSPSTEFVHGEVVAVDTDDRTVHLADDRELDYDYVLVAIGSRTAFFGIKGLREHAHTVKGLDDVLGIHDDIDSAAQEATRTDPAEVVVGGAGLSGIQVAGEVAEFRDEEHAPIDIHLVEGLDNVLPNSDPVLQQALRSRLEDRDVNIRCGEFIGEVDDETVYIGEDVELAYDVLVWTGGITGRNAQQDVDVEKDERDHRLHAGQDFQTEDPRVFALGDAAHVDQPGEEQEAPPTAQAAWQAADVVGENIAREIRGQPLKKWTFKDKGTVVSVGESAVAHDIFFVPVVDTFGGYPAKFFKKAIAARWISDISSIGRALSAWPDM